MIIAIAVNAHHYEHWCREHGLDTRDYNSVRYASVPDSLRGLIGRSDIEIVTLPEWYRGKSNESISEFDLLIKEHYKRRRQ